MFQPTSVIRAKVLAPLMGFACVCLPATSTVAAAEPGPANANVVVIVDTSRSMIEPNMDPEGTSVLVAKLLTDIVPGQLAAIRLLDIAGDHELLPSRFTDSSAPCNEDPSKICKQVEEAEDWLALARKNRLGASVRDNRGSAPFKQSLESHLAPKAGNSMFDLAFASALGVFDATATNKARKMVVWLSDGRLPKGREQKLSSIVGQLKRNDVLIESVIFGGGDTALSSRLQLDPPTRVRSPSELMKAFSGLFRRMVAAPYEQDGSALGRPSIEIKPYVTEAWVVVYGDTSLRSATLEGPGDPVSADYAADERKPAGAYRVAYLRNPKAGVWRLAVDGGGPKAAYAVVQRSSLGPALLRPSEAMAGTPVTIVAAIRAGINGDLIRAPDLLKELTFTATHGDQVVQLRDDGIAPDATAGDGEFSGQYTFPTTGPEQVRLAARNNFIDRETIAAIDVAGSFTHTEGDIHLRLGQSQAPTRLCKNFSLGGVQQGTLPFVAKQIRELPSGHHFDLRVSGKPVGIDADPALVTPGATWELCVEADDNAPSSTGDGKTWLRVAVDGSTADAQSVGLRVDWHITGLAWWQRWLTELLAALSVLAGLIIVYGYIWPRGFAPGLAVAFGTTQEELAEPIFGPVSGRHTGFYRHARAYICADYRVMKIQREAVAQLQQEGNALRLYPVSGRKLEVSDDYGDWREITAQGQTAAVNKTYRSGENLYFKVSTTRRTRT